MLPNQVAYTKKFSTQELCLRCTTYFVYLMTGVTQL